VDTLLCSIPDAAKALGLGRSKIYELIGEGRLDTVSIGRRRLVRTDSVRLVALGEHQFAGNHGASEAGRCHP
jgi:excisionase family DNA binding protein